MGVPRHHSLNVTCQVAAYPPPTTFQWALKSSTRGGLLYVPDEMITSGGSTSWISYTPRASVDYGELLCWAHTARGRQRKPCIARLLQADRPDPPEKCTVAHRTPHTLTVSCNAAHDGGLPQTFFMRVRVRQTDRLQATHLIYFCKKIIIIIIKPFLVPVKPHRK